MDKSERQLGRMAEAHSRVERPWGAYTVLHVGKNFQIKMIEVEAGKRLSLQFHRRRDEHWTIVSGDARVTKDETTFLVGENETVHIARKGFVRLTAVRLKM